MGRLTGIMATGLALMLIGAAAWSATINVPGDYETIQAAIGAAVDGDTVLVQPGTYNENVAINGKEITVASLTFVTGDASYINGTIIEGVQLGSVVSFKNTAEPGAALVGFTIQHGDAHNGGGIFMRDSKAIVSRCNIRNNNAVSGGGMLAVDSNPIISYCTISFNSAEYGGGILLATSVAEVTNCTFYSNTALDAGGAICSFESDVTVQNCILWDDSPEEIAMTPGGDPSILVVTNSDVQGGEDGIVTNDNGAVNWGNDNLDVDPLFVDPENGDFNLDPESPLAGLDMGADPGENNEEDEITPVQMIEALIADIDALRAEGRICAHQADLLRRQLGLAIWHIDHGRTNAAIVMMIGFEIHVHIMVHCQRFSEEIGRMLLEAAVRIERVLRGQGGDGGEILTLASEGPAPERYYLSPNYPNPFNPSTQLSYGLPEASNVRIAVYDAAGRLMSTLVDGQQAAGDHTVTWHAGNAPAGLYLVMMQTGGFNEVRRITLTK